MNTGDLMKADSMNVLLHSLSLVSLGAIGIIAYAVLGLYGNFLVITSCLKVLIGIIGVIAGTSQKEDYLTLHSYTLLFYSLVLGGYLFILLPSALEPASEITFGELKVLAICIYIFCVTSAGFFYVVFGIIFSFRLKKSLKANNLYLVDI
ncbi:hypothetical protein SteCoe_15046 [Stentor coeruleus]|uniref:Uncharacterized protein n=1 Tax=Stentor coeruleus TaxID=5963 RepID=A0A1R2C4P8_9CILI|nr:hypothetical protein SteCoe_15046 [Stentor coeruleus]